MEVNGPSRTGDGDISKRIMASGPDGRDKADEKQLLTRLPDDVLLRILSLLPTHVLVKTFLVPRFLNLWPFVHNLYFHFGSYYLGCDSLESSGLHNVGGIDALWDERFWNIIRHVLRLHQSPTVGEFLLRVPFLAVPPLSVARMKDEEYSQFIDRRIFIKSEIDACIRFAVRKKVEVFRLDLHDRVPYQRDYHYKLSRRVFRLRSLTELSLGCCKINPAGMFSLPSLRILSLKYIVLTDELLDDILSGCPLLEDLSLNECPGLDELKIMNPKTKTLTLLPSQHLAIVCPNIVSLKVCDWAECLDLIDVSSLRDATIYFCCLNSLEACYAAEALMEELCHSRALNIYNFSTKVHFIQYMDYNSWDLTNFSSQFSNLKLLNISLLKMHLPGLSRLLMNSPHLETFTLDISGCKLIRSTDLSEENCWNSNGVSFHCLEHHMRSVTILCSMIESYVFQLVEFLLTNAAILEKMVISISVLPGSENCASEDVLQNILEQCLGYHKASTRAVIHIVKAL